MPTATYTISDGNGGTDSANLSFADVTPVNDPPVAVDDGPVPVTEDTPATGSVLPNDSDVDGDLLTVTQFTVAGDPTVYTAGQTATIAGVGTLVINADGSYTFTPIANYNGPVPTATYTISDGNGGTDSANLSFANVTPVNDVPVAVDDSFTGRKTQSPDGHLTGNDTPSGDGGNVWSLATGPSHGTVVVNPDGTFTYTPNANYNGPDSFTYTITDADGSTSTATVTIDVTPVDDVPVTSFPEIPPYVFANQDALFNELKESAAALETPAIQAEPALYVLFSVNDSSNEMTLMSGWGVSQADSVTMAELHGGSDRNLSFAAGEAGILDGPGGLSGRDYSPLHKVELNEANALYVQRAVRQESLGLDNGLFVQHAVRGSALESQVRDARISSQLNSATPGVTTLYDPFALGNPANPGMPGSVLTDGAEKSVDKNQSMPDDSRPTEMTEASAPPIHQLQDNEAESAPQFQPRAATAFSSQLQNAAAEFHPYSKLSRLIKRRNT